MIVLLVIYASDDPKESSSSGLKRVIGTIDMIVWCIFVLEWLVRVLVLIFVDSMQSYTVMSIFFDMVILILGFFTFIGYEKFSYAKIFRTFKVMVVMSKINFVEQIVKYLALSLKNIVSIYLYLMLLYLCFAVIFVRSQGGAMFYCDTSNIEPRFVRPSLAKVECVDFGGDWVNSPVNFDNVYNAWKALFVLSTGDGWIDMLWRDFDSNKIIDYPTVHNGVEVFHYKNIVYIVFMILFYFFLLDVFTGSIIQEYYKQRNKSRGINSLTKQQMDWVYLQKMILEQRPVKKIREKKCCCISNLFFSKRRNSLEILKLFLYVGHMLVWSTAHYPMDPTSKMFRLVAYCYLSFFIIWTLEVVCLVFIVRSRLASSVLGIASLLHYVISFLLLVQIVVSYDVLDGSIAAAGDNLSNAVTIKQNDSLVISLRILLIMRAMTATKYFYNIKIFQKIVRIFLYILPSFISMIVLVLVIIFIFAIIGLNGFPYISQDGSGINQDANFSDFFRAFTTLFRICFGDNWLSILSDLTSGVQPNRTCIDFENSYENYAIHGLRKCGSEHAGFTFLFSFYTMVNFIFFNILIAIVLEAFEINYQQEATIIQRKDIEAFIEQWKHFDENRTSMIRTSDLRQLLRAIHFPLSIHSAFKTVRNLEYLIARLSIPLYTKASNLMSSQRLFRRL